MQSSGSRTHTQHDQSDPMEPSHARGVWFDRTFACVGRLAPVQSRHGLLGVSNEALISLVNAPAINLLGQLKVGLDLCSGFGLLRRGWITK